MDLKLKMVAELKTDLSSLKMNLDSDIRRHFQPLEKKQTDLMNQVL